MPQSSFAIVPLILAFLHALASAQDRCDCSVKTGSCEGAISLGEKSFTVTSNSPQCSRLEWVLDGKSRTSTAMDGKAVEQRPSGKGHPDFWLKSCYVCADAKLKPGAKPSVAEKPSAPASLLGKWCAQGDKEKASYTIAPDGATTRLAFGRTGRKFDKFSCNASSSQCVGEINGIKNVLAGEGTVNLRYTYATKTAESGSLIVERISAADGKILGTTTTSLARCE